MIKSLPSVKVWSGGGRNWAACVHHGMWNTTLSAFRSSRTANGGDPTHRGSLAHRSCARSFTHAVKWRISNYKTHQMRPSWHDMIKASWSSQVLKVLLSWLIGKWGIEIGKKRLNCIKNGTFYCLCLERISPLALPRPLRSSILSGPIGSLDIWQTVSINPNWKFPDIDSSQTFLPINKVNDRRGS